MNLLYFRTLQAFLFFIIQYSSLAYLLLSGSIYPGTWYLPGFYIAGLILGIWAIIAMRFSGLNAGPDPLPGTRLVDRGPYSVIRHPMYAAILLVFIPLVISDPNPVRIAVLGILVINLVFKLNYEEKRLAGMLGSYEEYSGRTWRLIPLVY